MSTRLFNTKRGGLTSVNDLFAGFSSLVRVHDQGIPRLQKDVNTEETSADYARSNGSMSYTCLSSDIPLQCVSGTEGLVQSSIIMENRDSFGGLDWYTQEDFANYDLISRDDMLQDTELDTLPASFETITPSSVDRTYCRNSIITGEDSSDTSIIQTPQTIEKRRYTHNTNAVDTGVFHDTNDTESVEVRTCHSVKQVSGTMNQRRVAITQKWIEKNMFCYEFLGSVLEGLGSTP